MTVIELIIALQGMPSDKEVLLDFTKPGMEVFKLMGVHAVTEIESDGEEFVILSGVDYEEDEQN